MPTPKYIDDFVRLVYPINTELAMSANTEKECIIDATNLIKEQQAQLDTYRVQCNAAMRAQSLGLCKKAIKHAIEDDNGR